MKLQTRKKMAGCVVADWFTTGLACLTPPVGYGQETAESKAKMQPLPMSMLVLANIRKSARPVAP